MLEQTSVSAKNPLHLYCGCVIFFGFEPPAKRNVAILLLRFEAAKRGGDPHKTRPASEKDLQASAKHATFGSA